MRFFFILFCLVSLSFAKVISDLPTKFVYADDVKDVSGEICDNGAVVAPENSFYRNDSDMPYRVYRVAVPSKEKPSVVVKDVSSIVIGKYCSDKKLKFLQPFATVPVMRDGVWMADVWVPLLKGSSATVSLRKQFEVSVVFRGSASGNKPGKRALAKIMNPRGASVFGQNIPRLALKKASNDFVDNTTWIADFLVGDENISSFSETGLYGVAFDDVQKAMSSVGYMDGGIRINDLRLYGASADTLPDVIANSNSIKPEYLHEIPLDVVDKNANNIFDKGDSLYFVGYGTATWKRVDLENATYATSPMEYYFSQSPYSFYQHFQLGVNTNGTSLRLKNSLPVKNGGKELKYLRYVRAEKDLLLRDTYFGRAETGSWEISSGKEWFWAWNTPGGTTTLSSAELALPTTVSLPNRVENGKSYFAVSFLPRRSTGVTDVGEGVTQVKDAIASSYPYEDRFNHIQFSASANNVALANFSLSTAGNFVANVTSLKDTQNSYQIKILPSELFFDRFEGYSIAYEWNPATDSSDWILPGKNTGLVKIPVQSGRSIIKFSNGVPVGRLASQNGFTTDSIRAGEDARYLLYNPSKILRPKVVGIIPRSSGVLARPQNISSKTEYLIIAPQAFQKQALQLANFRSSSASSFPLATTLVLAEDIYRLYTGGSMSPVALRNYIAYARSVAADLRYVLLAGAGHFDYRQMRSGLMEMQIPTFQKEDAVIEDFFAVLDSGESVQYGNYDLDLSVGRLPVYSVSDFEIYNEKVFSHEQKSIMDNGKWRSVITFSADDAKNNGGADKQPHTAYIESLASLVDSISKVQNKKWQQNKVYLLDYKENATGKKPEAASNLRDAINQGTLFTVYFGHGNLTDWASEGLLTPGDLSKYNNSHLYTILASFSCSLGRFDLGNERSLSEQFVQSPGKGSIISIGASRESYGGYNTTFAKNFFAHALGDSAVRIGDAFIRGKGLSMTEYSPQRYNNERYVILGEPVISMPVDEMKISLDSPIDSIMALDKMVISGSVSGLSSGKIYLHMQEGKVAKNLSNAPAADDSVLVNYEGSLIYSEIVDVKNGRFTTEFITPRKISFGDSSAEFSAYAFTKEKATVGRYLKSNVLIAGMSSYADSIHDNVPPNIKISTCASSNESFLSEGQKIVLESPACLLVNVEDSTALDFSKDADEGVSFEVLNKTAPFHPYPYVEQTSKKVVAKMSFPETEYPPGVYTFKVRALDILGNASTKTVTVEISEKLVDGLADVFNAPNPVGKKGTTFYFKDLAVGRSAVVSILIYNQNGRLVQRLNNVKSGVTTWNGRDFHNRLLANGLYHYVVRSEVPGTETSPKKVFVKKQKLVISR